MILIDLSNFDLHLASAKVIAPVSRVVSTRSTFGRWILVVTQDPFTENVTCLLTGRDMFYEQNAVIFQFARATKTSDAVYRVDHGQPRAWRANLVKLIYNGVTFHTDDLTHPDGGRVAIPWDELRNASVVEIKPNSRSRVSEFRLSELANARVAAGQSGCGSGFVDAKTNE